MPRALPLVFHGTAIAALALTAGPAPRCDAGVESILSTGQASPDGNGEFGLFGIPVLSNSGRVAVLTQLADSENSPNDSLAFATIDGASVSLAARTGVTQVDGVLATGFLEFFRSIDDGGRFYGNAVNNFASIPFAEGETTATAERLIATTSPSGGNSLLTAQAPQVGGSGAVAYAATYAGGNPEAGVYLRSPAGVTSSVLLEGAAAPGGGVVQEVLSPSVNSSSQVALLASANDGADYQALLRYQAGVGAEIARQGQTTLDGVRELVDFQSLSAINNAGGVAFAGDYREGAAQREGVFLTTSAGVRFLAGGVLPGGSFSAFDISIAGLNESRQVLFESQVASFTRGVYLADEDAVTPILLTGQATPGGDQFITQFSAANFALNSRGDVVFFAGLADAPSSAATSGALFRFNASTGLEQLFAVGDPLFGGVIAGLGFAGHGGSLSQANNLLSSGLNELGQIAFVYELESGEQGVALFTPEGTSGDYNDDGFVDATDYAVWRDFVGSPAGVLPNDSGEGLVGSDQYEDWRRNFGPRLSSSAPAAAAVPEPAVLLLVGAASLPRVASRPRRRTAAAGTITHRQLLCRFVQTHPRSS